MILLCVLIQISQARSTYPDDDEDQNIYLALNNHFNGKYPFEEDYYNKKPVNHDDINLAKRIIMLPRVGRRSIPTK
jgi:hypothetical protein